MKNIPLVAARSLYGISEAELRPLRGGHFAHVYGFNQNDREFVLRLSPPNADVDVTAQRSILAWMAYLAGRGAFVPAPLSSQNGNLVEVISLPEGEWLAVAFTQADGILAEEIPLEEWDDTHFQMLGRSVGRMHAIARGYVPSNGLGYPEWEAGGNLFSHQIRNEPWLKEKQSRLLEQIRALPRSSDAYGLVHCDLHFGNFLVDLRRQILTLIDFDDCAYGWFVMDFAVPLFDILVLYTGADKDEYGANFLRNFQTGYLAENPLSTFWLEQLPLFLKLLEVNLYDMAAKSYPDGADEWVMKFMPGRMERLENDTPCMNLNFSMFSGE